MFSLTDRMSVRPKVGHRGGFTLVELLVVIGIIAVLIGILIASLSKARQQSRTVVCAAQMRDIMTGLLTYASEHNGTMPVGFAWRRAALTASGYPSGTTATSLLSSSEDQGNVSGGAYVGYRWAPGISWAKTVTDQALKNGEGGIYPVPPLTSKPTGSNFPNVRLLKQFVCPEVAAADDFNNITNAYGANPVILVNQAFEVNPNAAYSNYRAGIFSNSTFYQWSSTGVTTNVQGALGGTNLPIGPAKLSQLYGDNAVLWDTQAILGTQKGEFVPFAVFGGFGMSGIDGGRLAEPQKGWRRYRGMTASALPEDQPDKPIIVPTFHMEQVYPNKNGAGSHWVNADLYTGYMTLPDQIGNARFRHNNDRVCNVAFADGSVRSLTLSRDRLAYKTSSGTEVAVSDFLRQYLLIKRPGAIPPPQMDPP